MCKEARELGTGSPFSSLSSIVLFFELDLISLFISAHIFFGLFLLLFKLFLIYSVLAFRRAIFNSVLSLLASARRLSSFNLIASSKARSLSPSNSVISSVIHKGLSTLTFYVLIGA